MKVHHCFIRPIQHYKFFILCQVLPLSHKPYDKSHTLPEFPNLDSIMHYKNEGLSPLKAGQIQVVTKTAVTGGFFKSELQAFGGAMNDKALGAIIWPLLPQQEAERPIQVLGSCRDKGRRELTCQSSASTKAELICSQLPGTWTEACHGSATSSALKPIFSLDIPVKSLQTGHKFLVLLNEVGNPFCS